MKHNKKHINSYYCKPYNSDKSPEGYLKASSGQMKLKDSAWEAYQNIAGKIAGTQYFVSNISDKNINQGVSDIEKKFNESATKWRKETSGYSTMIHIAGNNNYLDIIGLGPAVLPFILKDLQQEPDYWFVALTHIAKPKQNPVLKQHIGDIDKMAEDWLNWGKQNNII